MADKEWIEINGAKMDRTYFEANVNEARLGIWYPAPIPEKDDHRHCIVCELAMPAGIQAYRSSTSWICKACFSSYVESGQ